MLSSDAGWMTENARSGAASRTACRESTARSAATTTMPPPIISRTAWMVSVMTTADSPPTTVYRPATTAITRTMRSMGMSG